MTWFHVTSFAKWRKMRRHWRVSLGERICTSSSTTPASCRYSHWHPPYVTITHSMRGSRRDTLIFIGGKSQHETTVETHTEKRYWHWRISQSQSWTRLWIRITKCTYIQKRFSCSICIVSTAQWRLGLRFSHCPLVELRAKLSYVLEWRHLLTVKLPRAAQNSACCDVQNTEHRFANVCVRRVQRDYLFYWNNGHWVFAWYNCSRVFPKDVKSQVECYGPIEVGSREEVATCPGFGEGTHCRRCGIPSRRGIHSWSTDSGRSKVCRHHSSWRRGHSCLGDCCAGWDKGITLCLGSTVRMQKFAHFPPLFNGCGPHIYRYTGLIPMACQFTDVAGMNSTIW